MKGLFTKVWAAYSKTTKYNVMPAASNTGAIRQEGVQEGAVAVSHAKVPLQGVVAFAWGDAE